MNGWKRITKRCPDKNRGRAVKNKGVHWHCQIPKELAHGQLRQLSWIGLFPLLTGIRFENGGKSHYRANSSKCTTDVSQLVPVRCTSYITNDITKWRRKAISPTHEETDKQTLQEKCKVKSKKIVKCKVKWKKSIYEPIC